MFYFCYITVNDPNTNRFVHLRFTRRQEDKIYESMFYVLELLL